MVHQSVTTLLDAGYGRMAFGGVFLPLKAAPDGLGAQTQKKQTMGSHADRNEQFERIAALKLEYVNAGNPMVSIDTKKKELLGNFFRAGKLESKHPILVNDHDFPSAADGKLIPHGILDLSTNLGSIHLNTSHDTSDHAREVRLMVKK